MSEEVWQLGYFLVAFQEQRVTVIIRGAWGNNVGSFSAASTYSVIPPLLLLQGKPKVHTGSEHET